MPGTVLGAGVSEVNKTKALCPCGTFILGNDRQEQCQRVIDTVRKTKMSKMRGWMVLFYMRERSRGIALQAEVKQIARGKCAWLYDGPHVNSMFI